MAKRVEALESEGGAGVVALDIYDGETRDEAITAHVAAGGKDPAGAEIIVFLKTFEPRPAHLLN